MSVRGGRLLVVVLSITRDWWLNARGGCMFMVVSLGLRLYAADRLSWMLPWRETSTVSGLPSLPAFELSLLSPEGPLSVPLIRQGGVYGELPGAAEILELDHVGLGPLATTPGSWATFGSGPRQGLDHNNAETKVVLPPTALWLPQHAKWQWSGTACWGPNQSFKYTGLAPGKLSRFRPPSQVVPGLSDHCMPYCEISTSSRKRSRHGAKYPCMPTQTGMALGQLLQTWVQIYETNATRRQ